MYCFYTLLYIEFISTSIYSQQLTYKYCKYIVLFLYSIKYKLTAYCGCKKCSGKWGTRTASGKKAKQGRTIAVDRRKIKLGTKVKIKGKTYVAEDVGGGVKGKHIDVFFSSHKQTMKFGKKTGVKVYKVK